MRWSPPTPERVARSLAMIAAAYFVFWACAPPTSLPPPVPMAADQAVEFGGAATGGAYLTTSRSCPESQGCSPELDPTYGADAQLWLSTPVGDRGTLGALLFGGTTTVIGGGGFGRVKLNSSPDSYIGLQGSAGWLWASVGVPLSVRVAGDTWLYTSPSVGFHFTGLVSLPVGVSVHLAEDVLLNAELNYTTDVMTSLGYYEVPLVHAGLGIAKRW
jgi:hypothetical protein